MGAEYSWLQINQKDAIIGDTVTFLRESFDPDKAALVTENWVASRKPNRRWLRHVMYYLPEFHTYEVSSPLDNPSVFHVWHRQPQAGSFSEHENRGFFSSERALAEKKPLEVKVSQENLVFLTGDFLPTLPQAGWRIVTSARGTPFYVADLKRLSSLEYGRSTFHYEEIPATAGNFSN
jgi:hypothetical protein